MDRIRNIMIGRTLGEEAVYNKYAEEEVLVSKAGLSTYLKEQGDIIEELIMKINDLENHLGPLTISHPERNGRELDNKGDSEVVSAVRVHNHMLIMAIERLNDLRSHTQI